MKYSGLFELKGSSRNHNDTVKIVLCIPTIESIKNRNIFAASLHAVLML